MNETQDVKNTSPRLALASLQGMPENVSRPQYKREALSPGILHFGPGNFHRAHQAVYLDSLMNAGKDLDWGIIGASVMPGDAQLRSAMLEQDCLFTVVTQSSTVSEAHIAGPMIDYLPVGDTRAILDTLANPAIRIVSMTVTEGGYFVDAATGTFDPSHPAIVADVDGFDNPQTVFGLIVKGLANRRDHGEQAFTVMSCDNLPHNGVAARNAVVGFARLVDPALAEWIETHSSFPNGMVDRITPATGDRERERVKSLFGVDDQVPVFCEDYLQWVLEDKFVAGRPAFEQAGVEIVPDVSPYEMMKIRILNGGHAILAYPAGLLGIVYAHEAMQDDSVRAFLEAVQVREILPVVPPVPGVDIAQYQRSVVSRFSNPAIADTIRRLCFDGSNRQPKFTIATMADRLNSGGSIDGLALAAAFWCHYCEGSDQNGQTIEPNDPSWETLQATAQASKENPLAWLAMRDVYGELGEHPVLQKAFSEALHGVRTEGVRGMIDRYLAQG